jgi:hypothetical protein
MDTGKCGFRCFTVWSPELQDKLVENVKMRYSVHSTIYGNFSLSCFRPQFPSQAFLFFIIIRFVI